MCLPGLKVCLLLTGLPPLQAGSGAIWSFDEVFRKTHVNTCGVKLPHQNISVATELLQMSSGTHLSGKLHSFRIAFSHLMRPLIRLETKDFLMEWGWLEKKRFACVKQAEQNPPGHASSVDQSKDRLDFTHKAFTHRSPLGRSCKVCFLVGFLVRWGGSFMSLTLKTLSRCVCDLRPGVFLHRRWIENGVCAFKAPDCLSLCAAERLTPSGHSGHLSGGRAPSWRSSKRKQP